MTDSALVTTSAVDPEVAAAIALTERLKPLKDALGLKDLTDQEVQLFGMVAQRSGLDPFAKQIYAVKRGGKVTFQTGIDGYRSTAARTKEYAGSDEPEYETPCPCNEGQEHPSVARVTVKRIHSSGRLLEQVGVARFHEYKPSPDPMGLWTKMPYNQIAKCAEANGLRKLFPSVLADLYVDAEMDQAGPPENGALVTAAAQPNAPARLAARRAVIEGAVDVTPTTDTQDEAVVGQIDTPETVRDSAASSAPIGYELFKARLALADPRPTHVVIVDLATKQTKLPDLSLKNPKDWPLLDPAWIRLANGLDLPQLPKEA